MVNINLIPLDLQLSISRQCRIRRWTVVFSIALSALFVKLSLDWIQHANADELRIQNRKIQSQLEAAHGELRSVTAEARQAQLQVERAKALRSKRAWSGMFGLIGSCMPEQCWLRSIATDPDRPTIVVARNTVPPQAKSKGKPQSLPTIDAPRRLNISGYAPDAAQPHAFVANLKETGVFVAVTLESSKIEPVLDGTYTRFELFCEW